MKINIRKVVIEPVEADIEYPFYRMEILDDDEVRYWKFSSPSHSTLIYKDGIRTTMIDYNTHGALDNTQLTYDLLRCEGNIDSMNKTRFDAVVNAHIVELVKLMQA